MKPGSETPVVLVGCSGLKVDYDAPARDLYISSLFRFARRFAESRKLPWAVLSALHGLVLPDTVLRPYDLSATALKAGGRKRLRAWGELVRLERERLFPRAKVVFLAGSLYRGAVEDLPAARLEEPLAGLGVGRRLQWFRRETGALSPVPS